MFSLKLFCFYYLNKRIPNLFNILSQIRNKNNIIYIVNFNYNSS